MQYCLLDPLHLPSVGFELVTFGSKALFSIPIQRQETGKQIIDLKAVLAQNVEPAPNNKFCVSLHYPLADQNKPEQLVFEPIVQYKKLLDVFKKVPGWELFKEILVAKASQRWTLSELLKFD